MTCNAETKSMMPVSNGNCDETNVTSSRNPVSVLINGETSHADDDNCKLYDVDSLLRDAPVESIWQRTHVDREESLVDHLNVNKSSLHEEDVTEKVDIDFVDGQILMTVTVRSERTVPMSQSDDIYKSSAVIVTRTVTIDMTCTPNRRQLYSMLQRRRNTNGSLDAQEMFKMYQGLKEVVEANEVSRKASVKSTSLIHSSFPSSASCMDRSNGGQINSAAGVSSQRESALGLLSPRARDISATVSPLTGTRLVSRSTTDDIVSPRSRFDASYSNGLTAEPQFHTPPSSSSYGSRMSSLANGSSLLSRLDNASDSVVGRYISNLGGYGSRAADAASYSWRSGQEDADSPSARLQSLRESYTKTMWNDSRRDHQVTSPGWTGTESVTPAPGLSLYDPEPTMELVNGTAPASSRYEKVMSARSRSARRGDVTRDGALSTARRITSPVPASQIEVTNLSDLLLPKVDQLTTERSTPFTMSSRAERMKSYGIGTTTRSNLHDVRVPAAPALAPTTTDNTSVTQLPAMTITTPGTTATTSPQRQATSSPQISDTDSVEVTTTIPNNRAKMPPATDTLLTTVGYKSNTEPDSEVISTVNSYNTSTLNGSTRRLVGGRVNTIRSSVQDDNKDIKTTHDSPAASTNGMKTGSEEKARKLAAGASETSDADEIAGSSLTATTLNKLQAAAAAAADAAASVIERHTETSRITAPETMHEKPTVTTPPRHESTSLPLTSNVDKTLSGTPERRTTTNHDKDGKVRCTEVSTSRTAGTSRARSRTPSTVQEMLKPTVRQQNLKSSTSVTLTQDAAASGSEHQTNGGHASSSNKTTKSIDAEAKSAAVQGDGNGKVKSRSKNLTNMRDMLIPANSGETEPAKLRSTSTSATTSTNRDSKTVSSLHPEKKAVNSSPATGTSSQASRTQRYSSNATQRTGPIMTDRQSTTHRESSSSKTGQQIQTSSAGQVTPLRTAGKDGRKTPTPNTQTSRERDSGVVLRVGEDDWKTALTDVIQASAVGSNDADTPADSPIQASPSLSSLQSEPPLLSVAPSRRKSASGEGLSSLMKPTASSMARRGSTSSTVLSGSAGLRSYAAPTSSSASRSVGMSRTTSSPALRDHASLSTPSRPSSRPASGRATPTGTRTATPSSTAGYMLQTAARAAKISNSALTTGRVTRPDATTTNTGRGAEQAATRTSGRSRNNSASSGVKDPVSTRK